MSVKCFYCKISEHKNCKIYTCKVCNNKFCKWHGEPYSNMICVECEDKKEKEKQ
jgi:hypothetical protein